MQENLYFCVSELTGMKKLYLFLVLISVPFFCHSQELSDKSTGKTPKGIYLDFNGGVSLPAGVFSSYDTKKDKSGYASTGYYGQLNLDWMGKNELGIAFQYMYQHNAYRDTAKSITQPGSDFELGSKGWSSHYLLAGPVYVNTFKRLSLDVRILGGVVFAASSLFSDKDPSTGELRRNVATGFAYEAGIGIGYEIVPWMVIKANLEFVQGFPSLKKQFSYYIPADTTSGTPGYYSVITHEIKKTITAINIGAGLMFKF